MPPPTQQAPTWHLESDNVWSRLGHDDVVAGSTLDAGWTIVHHADLDNTTDFPSGVMSVSTFRNMVGLNGSGYNVGTANANLFSVVDEPGFGRCVQWTAIPESDTGGISAFPHLPGGRYCLDLFIEYDVWMVGVNPGEPWVFDGPEGGGKWPGGGGNTPQAGESNEGVIKGANAPTGGNPKPGGCCQRNMDIADGVGGNLATNDEIIGYTYKPTLGSGFPPNTHLTPNQRAGVGPVRIRNEMSMNTVTTPGTGNADGEWRVYVGPGLETLDASHKRYDGADEILRQYNNCYFDQQAFSVFRGGATASWGPLGPYRWLMKNYRVGVKRVQGTLTLP